MSLAEALSRRWLPGPPLDRLDRPSPVLLSPHQYNFGNTHGLAGVLSGRGHSYMRPAIATDHDLIEQLKKHDEHAVTELVVTYKPKVYQLALRYLRNKEDAEEVSQDVLMKVINKIAAFRG